MKVSFALSASGGLNCPCKIFLAYMLGNAHGRNNLLSSLTLRTREISTLFMPTQSGGMEIIMTEILCIITGTFIGAAIAILARYDFKMPNFIKRREGILSESEEEKKMSEMLRQYNNILNYTGGETVEE